LRDLQGLAPARGALAESPGTSPGEPLEGLWFDRSKEYSTRNRGKTISPGQFAPTETVTLSPLLCWEHLSPEQCRARVEAIVQRIEETAAKGREESGSEVLGAAAVRAQKPFDQPARPKRPLLEAFLPPCPSSAPWLLSETPDSDLSRCRGTPGFGLRLGATSTARPMSPVMVIVSIHRSGCPVVTCG